MNVLYYIETVVLFLFIGALVAFAFTTGATGHIVVVVAGVSILYRIWFYSKIVK
ncbi:MAG: hypothetical protein IPK88_19665 [Saprospiraceae bacterium]|nr:hypothetical protein [Candidatus Defluviibacterium haderslevense]